MKLSLFAQQSYTPRITNWGEESPEVSIDAEGMVHLKITAGLDGRPYGGNISFSVLEFEKLIAEYQTKKIESLLELRKAIASMKK